MYGLGQISSYLILVFFFLNVSCSKQKKKSLLTDKGKEDTVARVFFMIDVSN